MDLAVYIFIYVLLIFQSGDVSINKTISLARSKMGSVRIDTSKA